MLPQMAYPRGDIFALVAFVSHLVVFQIIFARIIIHLLPQFDVTSFDASVQLTQKEKGKSNTTTFALNRSWHTPVQLSILKKTYHVR